MLDMLDYLVKRKNGMSLWLCMVCLEMKQHDAMFGFARDEQSTNQHG
jgi:hypothetical protein